MKPQALLEPMDMPDPSFPVKVHRIRVNEYGRTLFGNHWHKHLELLYFICGKAVVEVNGVPHHVQTGDLIFVNSNDLHAGVSLSDDLFYYALIIDPALLQSQLPDAVETKYMLPILQNLILFPNRTEQPEALAESFMAIVRELDARAAGYELCVKSELFRMLGLLVRSSNLAKGQTGQDYRKRIRELERFTPVLAYIEEHYQEELPVELLAGIAGLSRFHFSRLFKQLTDKSVTDYVNAIRIRHAEYLLYNTSMTVSEIALAIGCRDIYYFSRLFKKVRSIPPSEIRRNSTTL